MKFMIRKPLATISAGHVQQWLHARNCHDINQIRLLLADEVCMYQPRHPEPLGKSEVSEYFTALFRAYPDIQVETDGILIEGYEAACWERLTGTLTRCFPEMQTTYASSATGNTFVLPCAVRLTFQADGLITSIRMYWDWSLLLRLSTFPVSFSSTIPHII